MIKQTQDQYYGNLEDLPSKLSPGAIYNCTDTGDIYSYDKGGSLINKEEAEGGGTVLVASVTVTFANLPASAVGQIHFITDGGFGGTKGQPVATGGSTLFAVIWDGSDWLML